jgi:hypothetical protein
MKNIIKNKIKTILNEFHSLDEFTSRLSVPSNIDYDSLDNFLGNKDEKKIGHNTILHKLYNDDIAIKLWNTNIVVINKLNNIRLYSGGWETRTTADRINQLLPSGVGLYTRKGEWRVKGHNGEFKFVNGMLITPNGDIVI